MQHLRLVADALLLTLMHQRRGLPWEAIRHFFDISTGQCSNLYHDSVRLLLQHFVPQHLRFFDRPNVLPRHQPLGALAILPRLVAVIDTTYV